MTNSYDWPFACPACKCMIGLAVCVNLIGLLSASDV